ncbi:protein PLANT CADMIUM RESISTANCE 10 isoform X2 [Manihot esculenta]|uniref:RST domain-containing protein n=1 Tax=Manihot esculenta TaxID=3983 RepID=A0A2C9VJB9_MANES|nr:protein PLANT CADMIUM RESISTANCE 10 isoform X2 [Manihot esculenta]XP_021618199.1 protein PLANT CADMIUM RESISTANCE 10 isoform X2 [Manihot esculenta]OAY45611.1 hypothetical protein MANES_07G076100v8 [Manihot esculenta]
MECHTDDVGSESQPDSGGSLGRAASFGLNNTRTPKFPWTPLPMLFSAISSKVPHIEMERSTTPYELFQGNKKDQSSYVPPPYIPLGQSDLEAEVVPQNEGRLSSNQTSGGLAQWSSGICACCDDMQSCCVGLFCPCYLFGKNAEFLGSGTLIGSCMTHFILWAIVNTICCCMTDGILLGLPGCFVAYYACGYRRALREKYNLQEAPCGDFTTHFFCHLCANCQEYREIRERTCISNSVDVNMPVVTAPPVQTMESNNISE